MAGGYHLVDDAQVVLNSTEIMVEEDIGWVLIQEHPLPHPMNDLRGISIQNKIFMIGKNVLGDYLNFVGQNKKGDDFS